MSAKIIIKICEILDRSRIDLQLLLKCVLQLGTLKHATRVKEKILKFTIDTEHGQYRIVIRMNCLINTK